METKGREQSSNVIDRRPKTVEDIIDQESFPNKTQSSQFLIDTFKRARETGYSLPPEVFNVSENITQDYLLRRLMKQQSLPKSPKTDRQVENTLDWLSRTSRKDGTA